MKFYHGHLKNLYGYSSLLLLGFLICLLAVQDKLTFAQPLDPSLPGYNQVKPPNRPTVKIVNPQPGSILLGSEVKLKYIVNGIKFIAPGKKQQNIKGEGYIKVVFAREGYPVPTPLPFARNAPITFNNLPEGNYRITIEIVKNDGASYLPPVIATTKFKLAHPNIPSATIASPTPSLTPLRNKLFPDSHELILAFGLLLLITPAVYLLLRTKTADL